MLLVIEYDLIEEPSLDNGVTAKRLNEYLVKGFTMDDDRLKEIRNIDSDYFNELLERIREICASEKRLYLKITDIYAISIDYDPKSLTAKEFFATVQNKLRYAIHVHYSSYSSVS